MKKKMTLLRLRREVRLAGGEGVGLGGLRAAGADQVAEGERAKAHAHPTEQLAAGEEAVFTLGGREDTRFRPKLDQNRPGGRARPGVEASNFRGEDRFFAGNPPHFCLRCVAFRQSNV